jgi:hypothetical protein
MHSKAYYIELRARYQPLKIKLIFVLESPPQSGTYFYDPSGKTSETLFSAMMKVIGESPATKEEGLTRFAHQGFLLFNATYRPVNHMKNNRQRNEAILSDLAELIQDLTATSGKQRLKIVLVKANICRLLEKPLRSAGFNIINNGTVVPFPSHGHQTKFHQAIKKLFTQNRIGSP